MALILFHTPAVMTSSHYYTYERNAIQTVKKHKCGDVQLKANDFSEFQGSFSGHTPSSYRPITRVKYCVPAQPSVILDCTVCGTSSSHCSTDDITIPGIPASLPPFLGCIRQVTINHKAAMLSKPLAVHGAVGTQGCPHM